MWQLLNLKNKAYMQTKSFYNKNLYNIKYFPLLGYGLLENWCISSKEYRRSIDVKQMWFD